MLRPLLSKRKCPQLYAIVCRTFSDHTFVKRGAPDIHNGLPSHSEIADKLAGVGMGHYLHLMGQYFDNNSSLTRNILMKVGDTLQSPYKPEVVLDAALSLNEMKTLSTTLLDTKECRYISEGEVDAVGTDDWGYGYILEPYFAIFTPHQLLLHQNLETKSLLHLHSRPCSNFGHKLWMKDIESVFVRFSERPWTTHTLGVRLLDSQLNVLEYTMDGVVAEVDGGTEPTNEALGELMINTEWIVKAAAQLVHVATKNRIHGEIPLFVPKVVQADNNPWVRLRNSLWQDQIADKLEKSQIKYKP